MMHCVIRRVLVLTCALATASASAQIIQPPFDTDYSFVDLQSVPGVPSNYGGITFLPSDPNTILIGGAANGLNGAIYSIGVTRDVDDHVTGFTGTAALVSTAPGIGSGGIDGGLTFGPGGVLFYTSYSDNSLGQIKPGSAVPDLQIPLTPLGIVSSVGTLAFVPPGFGGAGRFKIVQYNGSGNWYDVTLAPDANGTYSVTGATFILSIGGGPEGVIYVPAGNPQFAANSILVSEYSGGSVAAYEVNVNGDPVAGTRRPFMTGLSGAEGAVIDPLTGDFLFSTFGGGSRVIVVRGFLPPPPTTSSTTTTSTSSTSSTGPSTTSVPTTSTSSSSTSTSTSSSTSTSPSSTSTSSTTSTSASSAPTTSSTTSTLPPSGSCATEPDGPTFVSLNCRLAELLAAVRANAGGLGPQATKLVQQLEKAKTRKEEAEARCGDANLKRAKSGLMKGVRRLIQVGQTLRSRQARRSMDPTLREVFRAEAAAIQSDMQTLKGSLSCP